MTSSAPAIWKFMFFLDGRIPFFRNMAQDMESAVMESRNTSTMNVLFHFTDVSFFLSADRRSISFTEETVRTLKIITRKKMTAKQRTVCLRASPDRTKR